MCTPAPSGHAPSTGAARRPRTGSPLFTRQLHVRLCLSGNFGLNLLQNAPRRLLALLLSPFPIRAPRAQKTWSGRHDSNVRPPRSKRGMLPGCTTPRCKKPPRQRALGGPTWRSGWFAVLAVLRSGAFGLLRAIARQPGGLCFTHAPAAWAAAAGIGACRQHSRPPVSCSLRRPRWPPFVR